MTKEWNEDLETEYPIDMTSEVAVATPKPRKPRKKPVTKTVIRDEVTLATTDPKKMTEQELLASLIVSREAANLFANKAAEFEELAKTAFRQKNELEVAYENLRTELTVKQNFIKSTVKQCNDTITLLCMVK